jgi:diguanylate cyclase (GGDEF)-like protein
MRILGRPHSLRNRLLVYGAAVTLLATPAIAVLVAYLEGALTWQAFMRNLLPLVLLDGILLVPLWFFLRRSILHPLKHLIEADKAVEKGCLEGRYISPELMPDHEVGEVMRSRNAMLSHMETLESRFRRSLQELIALMSSTALLRETQGLEAMLKSALEGIRETADVDAVEVSVLDEGSGQLALRAHVGFSQGWADAERVREMYECLCGRVATGGELLLSDDIRADPRATRIACRQEGLYVFACIPLKAAGKVLGVMSLHRRSRPFSPQEVDVLLTISYHLGVALENFRLYQETLQLAITDSLTGLYARRYALERLQEEVNRAARTAQPFSVLMIDLDGFKAINDRYGHLVGDRVLKETAGILKRGLRDADLLSRYGGDEFLALLPGTGKLQALEVAERIRMALEGNPLPKELEEIGLRVSASIGVATYPEDARTVEGLISYADTALYQAKTHKV